MSKEIERGFAYQPNEPTPDNPSEILMGISFGGVNYIDVEDYKKLQEVLKNTYETGREIAGELEKENQQLKRALLDIKEYLEKKLCYRPILISEEKILDIVNKALGGDK